MYSKGKKPPGEENQIKEMYATTITSMNVEVLSS